MALVKVLATDLRLGDKIIVNIAAVKGGEGKGVRLPVGITFNGLGQQLNPDGSVSRAAGLRVPGAAAGAAPVFDERGFNQATAAGDRREADRIAQAYADASDAFDRAQGGAGGQGGTLGQRIGNAVVQFVCDNYGAKETEGDHVIVRREEIIVKPVHRYNDAPVVFLVQMAPVWGV